MHRLPRPVAVLRALAVAALAVAAGAVPATAGLPSTPAPPGTTWALEPADGSEADGRVSLRHVLEDGASVADHVVLTNFSDHEATFAVYASDGIVDEAGSFDLLPPDTEPTGGGSWVQVGTVTGAEPRPGGGILLTTPAGSSTVVPLEVTVPAGATPGDHPAGVVAELVQGGDATLRMSSRVGVRLHLRVAGEVRGELGPDVVATYSPSWNPFAPGTVTVDYTLENTGNVRVGADVDVSLAGPFGVGGGAASAEHREVLPGQELTGTVRLEAWPLVVGSGQLVATPLGVGEDELPAQLLPATVDFRVWAVPWSQLLVLALLAAAPLLAVRLRRRSAARVQARIDAAVAAATAEAAAGAGPVAAESADVR